MERYEKYKDSGIAWLGEIPEHWDVKRIKHIATVNPPKNIVDKNSTNLVTFLPMENVSEDGKIDCALKRKICDLYQGFTFFAKNDVIVAKITPCFENGKGAFLKNLETDIGFGSTEFHVLRSQSISNSSFLYYLVKSEVFMQLGEAFMVGAAGQKRVPTDFVSNFRIGSPPLEEQKAIATYLDHKTAEIDQLIAQKQRLIELYEEEKTALINHAVTKGINPDVKLKPSGIDWLGDIPEHWFTVRLKFLTSVLKDGTHGSFKRVPQGHRLLSVRNISGDSFIFRDDDSKISEEDFLQITQPFKVCAGDIQLAIVGATLGKVAIVPKLEEDFATQRSVATIRTKEKLVDKLFLFGFFKSKFFQNYLWNNAGFSAQPGVYLGTLQNVYVPCSSLKEQKAIAEYIETKTSRIDTKIAKTQRIIELQKEYRTALISEAVTGKIKVPQLIT